MTQLSITTDYVSSTGSPEQPVRLIGEAGFTHLHWCHHFTGDFAYMPCEIDAIRRLMAANNVKLLDVHGSSGDEKCWWSFDETQRLAGVELVKNRCLMLKELGGPGHVIMHIPACTVTRSEEDNDRQRKHFAQVLKSLDELVPWLEKEGVRIALENTFNDTWETIEAALSRYPASVVNFCYDSGHGNVLAGSEEKQLPLLKKNRNRLGALHLNDNDGVHDLHQPPFMGTVDWQALADIIKDSSYRGPLSYEITMRHTPFTFIDPETQKPGPQPEANQKAYLADAHERCERFAKMVGEL